MSAAARKPRVLELVRPAGMVEEVRRSQRDVEIARLFDRLAVVQGLQDGELPSAFLQDARDTEEILASLSAGQPAPRPFESRSGGPHRRLDVGLACFGDLGQGLLGGRVDGLVSRSIRSLDEVTADKQSVRRGDGDDGA